MVLKETMTNTDKGKALLNQHTNDKSDLRVSISDANQALTLVARY